MGIRGRFSRQSEESNLPEILDTDFDVVVIGRAMLDHNNGCGVSDGLACSDCWKTAKVVVGTLREDGSLGDSPGAFGRVKWPKLLDEPWHFDLSDDDPLVLRSAQAIEKSGTDWAKEPLEFSKVAIAALTRNQRIEVTNT